MGNEATERITILLQARDKDFARQMERANKVIANATRAMDRNSRGMTRAVESNMARAGAGVLGFGKTFALGLAGGIVGAAFAGITSNIRGVISEIADLNDSAARIGLGVEDLQGLQAGFKLTGVEVAESAKALETFSQRIGDAANGEGELLARLQRHGIALRDQAGNVRPVIDLLRDYAGAISNAGSQQERLALGADAFGRGGRKLVMALAEAGGSVDGIIGSARAAGLVMDEALVKRAAELDDRFDIITMKLGVMFKGAIIGLLDPVRQLSAELQTLLDLVNADNPVLVTEGQLEEIQQLTDLTPEAAQRLAYLTAEVTTLTADAELLANAMAESAAELRGLGNTGAANALLGMANEMSSLVAELREGTLTAPVFAVKLSGVTDRASDLGASLKDVDSATFGNVMERLSGLAGRIAGIIGVARAAAAAVAAINASGDPSKLEVVGTSDGTTLSEPFRPDPAAPRTRPQAPAVNDIDFGLPDIPSGGGRGGGKARGGGGGDGFAARLAAIREETLALEAEAVALLDVAGAGKQYANVIEYARKRAELLHEAQKAGLAITPELAAEIDALALSYAAAGLAAEDAGRQLDEMQSRAERGVDAISDVFFAVLDGADAAKKAIASLLIEMAKVQFRNALLGLSKLGGGGGIFGLIGGLLTGKRAAGGDVRAGQPYLVNEGTPNSEVFVPSRSGAVLNVPQAQAALRGAAGGVAEVRTIHHVTVTMDESTGRIGAYVRDEAGRVVAQATPKIVRQAVGATYAASRENRFS